MAPSLLILPPDLLTHLFNAYFPDHTIPLLQLVCKRMKQLTDSRMRLLTYSLPSKCETLRYLVMAHQSHTRVNPIWYCPKTQFPNTEQLLRLTIVPPDNNMCSIVMTRLCLQNREDFVDDDDNPDLHSSNYVLSHLLLLRLHTLIEDDMLVDPQTLIHVLLLRRQNLSEELSSHYKGLANEYVYLLLRPLLSSVIRLTISTLDILEHPDWMGRCVQTLVGERLEERLVEQRRTGNILYFLIRGWLYAELHEATPFAVEEHVNILFLLKLLKTFSKHSKITNATSGFCLPHHRQIIRWIHMQVQQKRPTRVRILLPGDKNQISTRQTVVEIRIVPTPTTPVIIYRAYSITMSNVENNDASVSDIHMVEVPEGCTLEEIQENGYIPGLVDPSTVASVMRHYNIQCSKIVFAAYMFADAFSVYKTVFSVDIGSVISGIVEFGGMRVPAAPQGLTDQQLVAAQSLRLLLRGWLGTSNGNLRPHTSHRCIPTTLLALSTELHDFISEIIRLL